MSKRKRKPNIGPYLPYLKNAMATGASLSEAFPSWFGTENIDLEIGKYVKPYTSRITVNVKHHGKYIGRFDMYRRPS